MVATTPDLAAIAREIGGDAVDVKALAKPTEDAHFVDAKPSHIVTLNRADVLIEGGAELDAQDEEGRTAMMIATALTRRDVLKLLCERGADPWRADRFGRTASDIAERNHFDDGLALLESGCRTRTR